jgi:hypothetical protein
VLEYVRASAWRLLLSAFGEGGGWDDCLASAARPTYRRRVNGHWDTVAAVVCFGDMLEYELARRLAAVVSS